MSRIGEQLGFDTTARLVLPHIDDVGCATGANAAFADLHDNGFVTSGSVMVPAAGFEAAAANAAATPGIDLGVHLTLTSESPNERWRPLTATSPAGGLVDDDGFMWPNVAAVRANAVPAAVDEELRAQVELAGAAGIDVTHLDHHMGATLAPELAKITIDIAAEHRLPVLLPGDPAAYFSAVNLSDVDVATLEALIAAAHDTSWAVTVDAFEIGLEHKGEPCDVVTKRFITSAGPGITFLSFHCSAPGDIAAVHPGDHEWRVSEYRLLERDDFLEWVAGQDVEIIGFREIRDRITRRSLR
ncbi:MAG: ChbG/HpnK family deacetylase [Acidimicrobiia bacterium]